MDIQLAPKKWYVKYRALLIAGALFIVLVIGLLATALSPSKLRISAADLRIAEVVRMDFVEYVNADGTLQPIQTIKVNTKEAGIVERIVADAGSMLQAGDTILIFTTSAMRTSEALTRNLLGPKAVNSRPMTNTRNSAPAMR